MREMKNSGIEWIGDIPSDWKTIRMKSCFIQRDGGAWGDEATGEDGDTICLRIADFDYGRFVFKDTVPENLTKRNYTSEVIEKLRLNKDDILIEKSGGGEKTPVGRTVIFDKDYVALFANFMDRLRCADFIYPKYMQYTFVTFYKNQYTRNYIKQTTGIQNLDLTSMLSNETMPFPHYIEQKRIADFLDEKCAKIDTVIEKTKATIEEYKKLKQSVITQAVTKGIRPNRPMKDSGIEWIGEIPAEWDLRAIKTSFIVYAGATPKSEVPEFWDGDIRWITPADYKTEDKFVETGRRQITEAGYNSCGTSLVPAGSIVFSKRAPIGSVAITKSELCTNQGCLSCVPKIELTANYFYFMLSVFAEIFNLYGSGTTFKEISYDSFVNFRLPYPTVEEQKKIADYLDKKCSEIDELIAKKTSLLSELESYKKSLIYEYVTGKKEV